MSRLPEVRRRRAGGATTRANRRILRDGRQPRVERGLLEPQTSMIDREKVVSVLTRRFPGSPREQVAAAANAIVGLEDEWVEVPLSQDTAEPLCGDDCQLMRVSRDGPVKLFRRENQGR